MPQAPSWIDKVNYVTDFWVDPCNAPLIVYLRLARAPLGKAIITWVTFGLLDVLRGYARPSKALGGRPTQRRGKRGRRPSRLRRVFFPLSKVWRMIPALGEDTGGWVGKNLPGAAGFKGRNISQAEHAFWVLDDVGQRVLLMLLIADITNDFLYEWTTLLDMSEFCQRSSLGSLYATGLGTAVGGIIPCRSGSAPDVLWQEGDVGWNIATGSVGPRGWTCISAMQLQNLSGTPIQHFQRMFIVDSLGSRFVFSETQTIPPFGQFGSVLNGPIVGPGSFVSSHCATGGAVGPIKHDIAIFGGGSV